MMQSLWHERIRLDEIAQSHASSGWIKLDCHLLYQ